MRTAEELRYLILAIQREGNRLLSARLRPLGLTPSQGEVLRLLAESQPLTLTGLGELLVCETGNNPSRLVDRLVNADLVRREPDAEDRRQVALSLTPAGSELADQVAIAEEQLHIAIDDLIAGLPTAETLNLLRSVARHFPAGKALERRQHNRKSPDVT